MSRIAAFHDDAKACLYSWNSDGTPSTKGFFDLRIEDNTFICKWFSCNTKREYLITYIASDDYPENCCLFLVRSSEDSPEEKCEPCSVPLVAVLKKLFSELQHQDEEAVTVKPWIQSSSEDTLEVMSQKSLSATKACSGSSEEDYDNYDSSDGDNEDIADDIDATDKLSCHSVDCRTGMPKRETEEPDRVHPLLYKDMCTFQEFACTLNGADTDRCKTRKTFSSLATRIFSELGEVDCQLSISLDELNLSYQLCSAWKLMADEPLVVHLNFDNDFYLDCQHPPQVKVSQSTTYTNSVLPQLQNILKLFLQELWDKKLISNSMLESATQRPIVQQTFHTQEQIEDPAPVLMETTKSEEIEKPDPLKMSASDPDIYEGQAVNSATAGTSHSLPTLGNHSSSLGTSSADVKQMPSLTDGFLVMIYKYMCQRLPSLNEFCIICDNPHTFADAAMLMPAVCTRDLCIFGYQKLGLMANAGADIATGSQVVDLLITLVRAALFSPRSTVIFDPFPNIVDPADNTIVVSDKKKHFGTIKELVTKLPANNDILQWSSSEIHTRLEEKDRLLLPLLIWIIRSNRSHIVHLPKAKQFDFMNTPHQFLLLSSPPDQESHFQDLKNTHGSTFAFHGSPIENWHSIIRKGLMVASGTILQLNGAAHGRGIYLSPYTQVSVDYCKNRLSAIGKMKKTDTDRFLGENFTCMALCEVIKSEKLQQDNRDIWVVTDEKHVCTRFFFLWKDDSQPKNVNITQANVMKKVEDSISLTAGIFSAP